jgi:putative transposase
VAALIAAQRVQHKIPHAVACRALGVSRSWFYKHKQGEPGPRAARRQALTAEVRRLFTAHRGTYGSPRITADLREQGWKVSKNTVAAVMREQGLASRRTRKRRATTRPGKGRWRAPDLVKRDFPAQQLNTKWYGDGTEIPTGEGKLYLASVLDMASRRVLGFALGAHHDAQLAYSALVMAVAVRGGQVPGVIMHTDRGSGIYRGAGPAGLHQDGDLPVDGPAWVCAGQRGHRVLALHAGVRAPLGRALHHQGSGPGPGQRLDRGLQHPAAPLRAGHDVPARL